MSKGTRSPGEDVVIEKFVERRRVEFPELKVDSRPDKSNSRIPDIDAIAGIFAIEHTSVDTINGQRGNNASFLEIIPEIDSLSAPLDFWASIGLPWSGVENIRDRALVRSKLIDFVQNELPFLKFGHHEIRRSDIPFELYVSKRPDLTAGIYFSRLVNTDTTLPSRIAEQIIRKAKKLEPYKNAGKRTVLLLETEDIALMNQGIMLEAIQDGFENREFPTSVDEVWYADTTIPKELRFVDFTKALANNRLNTPR